ncbi:amidohydrolase [Flammeovirgaceae bacterium SG7u.111]|nr:amidohydrolase [Flammeovirgaceae bacterium SG7u.132]WPO37878.1 amidohydrolase [Flammeovirgaceae bacterium SG7u.111]
MNHFTIKNKASGKPSLLFLLFFCVSLWTCETPQTADLLIYGGTIYTVSESNPSVEAVVIQGDKIVFAGNLADAEKMVDDKTERLDLKGKTLTPGLIESHAHFLGVGYKKLNLDLSNTKSYEEIVSMVAEAAKKAKPGEWIQGRGWHQSKWDSLPEKMVNGFQTHDELSAVSPNNPVYLRHASGHAGFANAKAMEMAGVSTISPEGMDSHEVEGGEFIRDELGNATGVFNERAMGLITKHIPDNTPEMRAKAMKLAFDECLSHGITSFHDAGEGKEGLETMYEFLEKDSLKVRLYVMLSSGDTSLLNEWYAKGPQIGLGNNFLTVRSIKLYVDGALGSRGAWLLKDYEDRPGHTGHETTPIPFVRMVTRDGLEHGFQVCSHAIGDRANREVLDEYEAAFLDNPDKATDHRFRIEHAQHINGEDIPRFGKLGVIAAMQAIHMSSDRPWAIYRLGLARIQDGAYVWQKLLDSGAKVINGTDAPVEPIDPIACFYASVTRRTLKGEPDGGYEADQKMSREQALKSYTLDAAYGAFEEDIKGSIEVGKLADFTVFDQDIMTVPDDSLLATKIDYTIVGGKVVFERK